MKLLVIGLDGVDRRLIEHFDMPFLQGLLAEHQVLPLKEDLWSRGWTKMLSGLPGTATGAFYEQPALNGKPQFTQSFGSKNYPQGAGKKALWAEVDALGKRAAWLNLPTMMPAPALNGVVLGGAGGGFSPEARIPAAACHPPDLQRMMINEGMIWETRFVVSGIRHADLFFERCTEALWRRVRIYVEMVKRNGAFDLGFFVQKEPVVIANIFMYSIEQLMAKGKAYAAVHYLLNQFYSNLDDTLRYVFDELGPQHVMVVSDHGMAPFKKTLNFNVILEEIGVLQHLDPPPPPRGFLTRVKGRFAHEVRDAAGVRAVPKLPATRRVDHAKSQAFAHYYVPGIFLNDERFGGAGRNAADTAALTARICDAFNAHPSAKSAQLTARPFRSLHQEAPAQALLPELWVDHPEDCFPEQQGAAVAANPYYRDWTDMTGLTRDIGSGKKSSAALCVVAPEFLGGIDPERKDLDLTVVHELVLAHLK